MNAHTFLKSLCSDRCTNIQVTGFVKPVMQGVYSLAYSDHLNLIYCASRLEEPQLHIVRDFQKQKGTVIQAWQTINSLEFPDQEHTSIKEAASSIFCTHSSAFVKESRRRRKKLLSKMKIFVLILVFMLTLEIETSVGQQSATGDFETTS